jgi:hypothetical protein
MEAVGFEARKGRTQNPHKTNTKMLQNRHRTQRKAVFAAWTHNGKDILPNTFRQVFCAQSVLRACPFHQWTKTWP